jgi:hypothetical protein
MARDGLTLSQRRGKTRGSADDASSRADPSGKSHTDIAAARDDDSDGGDGDGGSGKKTRASKRVKGSKAKTEDQLDDEFEAACEKWVPKPYTLYPIPETLNPRS